MRREVRELLDRRQRAIQQCRSIHEKAESENRALTAEEQQTYDQHWDEAEQLRARADRTTQLYQDEQRSLEPGRQTDPGQPSGDPDTPETETRELTQLQARQADAFSAWCADPNSLSTEQRQALGMARAQALNPDLSPTELRAMTAGIDTSGGFLYPPTQWRSEFVRRLDDAVIVRQLATVEQIQGTDSLGVPTIEKDPGDPEWTSEVKAGNDTGDLELGGRELTPHPLARLAKLSMTLMRRSGGRSGVIVMERLGYRFQSVLELGYFYGSGNKQPLGIFTASPEGISTDRDVWEGNATTKPTVDGAIAAKYTLKAGYMNSPTTRWTVHRDAVKHLISEKNDMGYVWQPSTQLGQPDRLLNIPVLMSEFAPNTFAAGMYWGVLCDWRYYHIVDALGLQVQRLIELFATQNKVGFILRMESDGMPILEEAFVRLQLAPA